MEALTTRRLPGVYVRSETPPTPDALPRMDIAAFVGLASAGPLHTPVLVEEAAHFRDIFGADLPLAWDSEAGRTSTAHLGLAVEAFFRNGGTRCWVVRVADDPVANLFPIPTLLDAETGRPAHARARCGGSWSDALHVGTVLHAETLTAGEPTVDDGQIRVSIQPGSAIIRIGDVLRLTFDDDVQFLAPVIGVRKTLGALEATLDAGHWYRRHPSGLPEDQPVAVELQSALPHIAHAPLPAASLRTEGGSASLLFSDPLPVVVEEGAVLHLIASGGPHDGARAWFSVASFETGAGGRVLLQASEILWVFTDANSDPGAQLLLLAGAARVTERLTFELLTWSGQEIHARLGGLVFGAAAATDREAHLASSFWGALPTDDVLFLHEDGRPRTPVGLLERAALAPRFPLAGPETTAPLYVPLGMPLRSEPANAQRAVDPSDSPSAIDRDGLAGFEPTWFLDDDLSGFGLRALPGAVSDKLYIQRRALTGLHSLWPLDEVTLLAAPDATLAGWDRTVPPQPVLLNAPDPPEAEALAEDDSFRISWMPVALEAAAYELQVTTAPDFNPAETLYRGPQVHTYLYSEADCSRWRYLRLRVRHEGRVSPWSSTLVLAPSTSFTACRPPLGAPALELVEGSSLAASFARWNAVSAATRYLLEVSADPTFALAERIPLDPPDALTFDIEPPPPSVTYYRVRAERDFAEDSSPVTEVSPWSTTVRYDPVPEQTWTMRTPEAYDADGKVADLLAFQRAAVRFAAARADIVTVLSLPSHFREEHTAAHVASLTPDPSDDSASILPPPPGAFTGVLALSLDEERALSYAALYHPWVAVQAEGTPTQLVRFGPPDGAVVGLLAARALTRGAWIAPANISLRDALALEPTFDAGAWQRLLNRQVNLLRATPQGFMPLSAETLSATADLRPLNVRRLLILLRRLALREGDTYVFESNDAALRRRVRVLFEGLLERLFERGAFAGARPSEAFQVRTDDAVNTPRQIDRGQLIVELRVAPSQPLAFITVRLVQIDGVGLTTVEV